MALRETDLKKERREIYRILSDLDEENLVALGRYAAFLRHLQQMEDEEDIMDARAALAEGGESIPWEEVRKELDARHDLQN
jgi:hypothetical protein